MTLCNSYRHLMNVHPEKLIKRSSQTEQKKEFFKVSLYILNSGLLHVIYHLRTILLE